MSTLTVTPRAVEAIRHQHGVAQAAMRATIGYGSALPVEAPSLLASWATILSWPTDLTVALDVWNTDPAGGLSLDCFSTDPPYSFGVIARERSGGTEWTVHS